MLRKEQYKPSNNGDIKTTVFDYNGNPALQHGHAREIKGYYDTLQKNSILEEEKIDTTYNYIVHKYDKIYKE